MDRKISIIGKVKKMVNDADNYFDYLENIEDVRDRAIHIPCKVVREFPKSEVNMEDVKKLHSLFERIKKYDIVPKSDYLKISRCCDKELLIDFLKNQKNLYLITDTTNDLVIFKDRSDRLVLKEYDAAEKFYTFEGEEL